LSVSTQESRTGFDEHALSALPAGPSFISELRAQAFEEYNALPIPSQETEEWRYTDLSELDLGFAPWTAGGHADNLDDVPAEVMDAVGAVGERAGLQIQRNSEVLTSHLDPELASRGVMLMDLDDAAEQHPDLVAPHLHSLVPTSRTKFTAMHAAFRTGGTFLYVPPAVNV
jgi:Fe-S cluster assembly protein SufD